MGKKVVYVIGGVVVSLIALKILGPLIALLIVLGVVALPVVAYMMLDPSQRRRVRAQGRKRLGS
ncbi:MULTISPECIES: hypothetical protein [Actinomadura]|uniref:Uncharacterized protein n=1 Tax=Actinomadura litoris TaxID=2678616 RepID=A0A7K1L5X0_9ACTN|nr:MULTISPECIES: hypothetical protein [Actinomadura]MBT2208462.1 hypothetical protein [Actinomadura sp. NEAU-AAG7]MUN39693.1 hypothetical protein [Actinomadura litoris]